MTNSACTTPLTHIRPANASDASRIAEIIIINYRQIFFPIFKDEDYYFRELNVLDMAAEYQEGSENLNNTYVYDDGVVKGIIRVEGTGSFQLSLGSVFVIAATCCWGLENNCTRKISEKSTYEIVVLKGLFSGMGSCIVALIIGEKLPNLIYIVWAMLPFSTWAVFYAGMFMTEPAVMALGYATGIDTYIHVIPFMFYPIAAVLITLFFAIGIVPKIGPMKKAYARVKNGDLGIQPLVQVDENLGDHTVAGMEENAQTGAVEQMLEKPRRSAPPGKAIDFLLPMAVLIGVTIVTSNMLIAIIATLFVCLFSFVPRKLMTFGRFSELFIQGFADMLPVLAILLASFMVRTACGEMNLSGYVISLVEPYLNGAVLPGVVFLILAALTFITNSFWGIEVIALPIVIPLAVVAYLVAGFVL